MRYNKTVHDDTFCGRGDEVGRFKHLVEDLLRVRPTDQPSWSYVALIYGLGGIGKTTLLDRCHKLVSGGLPDRQYVGRVTTIWLDWESARERDPATFPPDQHPSFSAVLEVLNEACQLDKFMNKSLRAYRDLSARQVSAERKVDAARGQSAQTDSRNRPWAATSVTVIRTLLQLGSLAGFPPLTVDKDTGKQLEALLEVGAEGLSGLKADAEVWLRSHLTAEEFQLFVRPNEALASAFARCLRSISARRPMIFFLDAYEIIRRTDPWLRRVMAQSGPRVAWILSGRFEADQLAVTGEVAAYRREVKPSDRLLVMEIAGFSEEDLRGYLSRVAPERPPSPADIDRMYSATRGIPLAVGAAAALWARGVDLPTITSNLPISADHSTLVQLMTAGFLAHVDAGGDPYQDISKLLALALVDQAEDLELLGRVLETDNPTQVLKGLSDRHDFVFTRTLRLHDVVRSVFRDYLMDPLRRREVQEANGRAIELLVRRLSRLNGELKTLEQRAKNDQWTAVVSALTWHRFWAPEGQIDGWATVAAALPAAMAYNQGLGQVLLDIARRFTSPQDREKDQLRALELLLRAHRIRDITALQSSFEALNRQSIEHLIQPDEGCTAERSAIEKWQLGVAALGSDTHAALRHLTSASRLVSSVHLATELRGAIGEACQDLADRLIWTGSVSKPSPSHIGLQAAELATQVDPHNIANWVLLAQGLLAVKRHEEALDAIARAERLAPHDARVLHEYGVVLMVSGRIEDGLTSLTAALQIDPAFARAHSNRGAVLAALGRFDEALHSLDLAIEMDDKYPAAHCDRGVVLAHLDRFQEALASLDVALQIDPAFARAHSNRGAVLAALGRFDEALDALDQAVRRDSNDPAVHDNRSKVLSKVGRTDEGRAGFRSSPRFESQ